MRPGCAARSAVRCRAAPSRCWLPSSPDRSATRCRAAACRGSRSAGAAPGSRPCSGRHDGCPRRRSSTRLRVMTSRTFASGPLPSAMPRTAMSRSVSMPTRRSSSATGSTPQSHSFIVCAAWRNVSSGLVSSAVRVMTSRIFMSNLHVNGSRRGIRYRLRVTGRGLASGLTSMSRPVSCPSEHGAESAVPLALGASSSCGAVARRASIFRKPAPIRAPASSAPRRGGLSRARYRPPAARTR